MNSLSTACQSAGKEIFPAYGNEKDIFPGLGLEIGTQQTIIISLGEESSRIPFPCLDLYTKSLELREPGIQRTATTISTQTFTKYRRARIQLLRNRARN
jgi:hypothetical protein